MRRRCTALFLCLVVLVGLSGCLDEFVGALFYRWLGPLALPSVTSTVTLAVQVGGTSTFPALSGDGQRVAFESNAADLDPACANGFHHVFVFDTMTRPTTCVSVAPDGSPGNGPSHHPRDSAAGRTAA